jgi:hypothetical protein
MAKTGPKPKSALDRVFQHVSYDGGCWRMTRLLTSHGYAAVQDGGRRVMAHRLVYEALVGPIPDGYFADHLCRYPACINPLHIEPVPPSVNSQRGTTGAHLKSRTHCPKGHPYDEANTYVLDGRRYCRECGRSSSREIKRRKRREAGMGIAMALRTHCPRGHAYDEANTYHTKVGGRGCRACARERTAEKRRKEGRHGDGNAGADTQ